MTTTTCIRIALSTAIALFASGAVHARENAQAAPGVPESVLYYEPVAMASGAGTAARADKGGAATMAFSTLGREFELELEPSDVYAQGATVVWLDDAGRVVEAGEVAGQFYRGRIKGETGSWVRLQVRPGGDLAGVVTTADEMYFLEPAENFFGAKAAGQTVAYRLSDTDSASDHSTCATEGAHDTPNKRERIADRRAGGKPLHEVLAHATANAAVQPGSLLRAEIAVVADYEYFTAHGANTAADIAQIVNLVDGIYQAELGVTVQLLTTVVHTSSNDPFSNTTDPNTLLKEFAAYHDGNDNAPGEPLYGADLAHLFTGRDLNGSTIGVAWLNQLCHSYLGSALSQVDFRGTLYSKTMIVAHEMGHNFGAPHDNQSGSVCSAEPYTFIMNPSISGSQLQQFSPCSKSQIAPALEAAACLDTTDASSVATPTSAVPVATPTPTAAVANAAFVSQAVPSAMTAGQQYTVTIRMRNTGTTTWRYSDLYRLGAWNPADNTAWRMNRVPMTSDEQILPGQEKAFTWAVTAPSTPGTYNFQWRMVRDGVSWFGAASANTAVSVNASAVRGATFVSQSVPTSMVPGQAYTVSVTMQNTGGTTWTAASNYRLGALFGSWGATRVYLAAGESIAPGQQKTFTWTVRAPSTPGTYNFQWQMVQELVAWFGASSPKTTVVVGGTGRNAAFVSQSVPTTMQAGQTYAVSVTMQNTGGTTWTAADNYRLGALYGQWGSTRVYLAPGDTVPPGEQKTFTWTVKAPSTRGTYNFQWQMVQELVAWFGASSAKVAVAVQ
ncbi:MAG: M12 family metallo-peptidase [Candidatus Binatia bacterium]